MMKLRRLCNHGTMSAVINGSHSPAISSRSDTPDQEPCLSCANSGPDAQLMLDGLEGCLECGRQFGVGGTLALAEMGRTPTSETFLDVPPTGYKRGISSPLYSGPSFATTEEGSTRSGCSSKLNAVVSNILEASRSGSKSIAFTSWRLTSNMLSDMLSQAGVSFLQIDGTTNALRRSSVVAKFQEDQSVAVLIMTIDSCAVGLTLTNADQVHIIEPQWNPAIEAQAIGRAYRMGQTRPVTVIRYITEKSVEQNIAALQERKGRLATFTLDDSANGDLSSALEDMKFVLNPGF
ncbi:hypothetical protein TWF730_011190 [Orbilia blumenaviensis]|uniref:Helicase C-terminal domain-containing protein n=1 Tax=Orbilia blumenaviensis TaxID=1796055 RepID=A0AAV9UKT8_9PEZI